MQTKSGHIYDSILLLVIGPSVRVGYKIKIKENREEEKRNRKKMKYMNQLLVDKGNFHGEV